VLYLASQKEIINAIKNAGKECGGVGGDFDYGDNIHFIEDLKANNQTCLNL
jgi:hypothetical protein